jgi:hypothetical protein
MDEQKCGKCRGIPVAATIGLFILASTIFASLTAYKIKQLGNVLSVTGSAERTVKSDVIKWTSSFSRTTGPDNLADGNTAMARDLVAIKNYLKSKGVAETSIAIQPMTVAMTCENQGSYSYDKFGNQTCGAGRISGYSLQQAIVIESADVDKLAKVATEATSELVSKGVIFTSQSVEYYYNKLAELKLDLLDQATKNASERAERIAKSTGRGLGSLQSAGMGVFQVTAVNSMDISDYGAYDTSAVEKKVTAVVRASFSLR